MALRTKVKEYRENVFHVSAEELFEFMEDRHLHIPMPGPRTSPTDKEKCPDDTYKDRRKLVSLSLHIYI